MERLSISCLMLVCSLLVGCESLRFAPGEAQKQNAWLHNRTTMVTSEQAKTEGVSTKLQALCDLSEQQSRAFVSYCGLPAEFPKADTAEDILAESSFKLAQTATSESLERPNTWELADSALNLAIGISALIGGVYGTRAVSFLQQAKTKSQALKEIIEGNELFKQMHKEQADAFKEAQGKQSPPTRQLVAAMKQA